jgi:hypothetical protein
MSATAVSEVSLERSTPVLQTRQRLVVAWQHPINRQIEPVGFLAVTNGLHTFEYVANVRQIDGFRPLVGFPDLERRYSSGFLFPLFAQRAMDPRRSDYERYIRGLGLEPDADPWEQISRSRGHRQGDTLQLFPVPRVEQGHVRSTFLVHGHRHVSARPTWLRGEPLAFTYEQVEQAFSTLGPGSPLRLEDEPENAHNSEAVLTVSGGGVPVGYVPDLLVHDLHRLEEITSVRATVAHVNGPEAPSHMRLLVNLAADDAGDFEFFTGPRWESLA